MRGAAHIANPALSVAAAETDQARDKARHGTRARETILVHAQTQITVRTRRVRRQYAPINIPHHLRVLGRAERMPVFFALPGAIAERRRLPEIGRRAYVARTRPRQRETEERIDALQLKSGGVARRGPPDVGSGLKDERRRIRDVPFRQSGKVRRRLLEIAIIQGVEPGAEVGACRQRALEHQHRNGEHGHLSAAR